MSALNAVALILGWTFIGIVCLAIVAGVVIGVWQWLTEPEPARFEVVSRTWREGFSTHPTTAALLADRQTGCLYSLAEGKGASPLLTPDGAHAGCHPTTHKAEGAEG